MSARYSLDTWPNCLFRVNGGLQDSANPYTSAIMRPIAHRLTPAQMAVVAAYLNYLE
jgi:hypothetical protein